MTTAKMLDLYYNSTSQTPITKIDLATLKADPNGRELGDSYPTGSLTEGFDEWEQDMLTPDGKHVVLVYEVTPGDMTDDDGDQMDPDCWDWDGLATHCLVSPYGEDDWVA